MWVKKIKIQIELLKIFKGFLIELYKIYYKGGMFMQIDYSEYKKDMELALNYAIRAIEKELIICSETGDSTQTEVLKNRLTKFEFLLKKFSEE